MNLRNIVIGFIIVLLVVAYRRLKSGGKCTKCGSHRTRKTIRIPQKDKKRASPFKPLGHFEQGLITCENCGHVRQISYKYIPDGRGWRELRPWYEN